MGQQVVRTKDMVRFVLENALKFEWTIQGLGMLRAYLDPDRKLRLHIWHPLARMEEASDLHTHPWGFDSLVVVGKVTNQRFVESDHDGGTDDYVKIKRQTIRCGVGGGLIGEPEPVILRIGEPETYIGGDIYHQEPSEIHRSQPEDGTVTIIRRNFGVDTEHAFVYFKDEWGTAEPRIARGDEILTITQYAINRYF